MRRILLALAVAACAVALAQVDLRGEIEVATDAAASGARRAQAGWTIAAHLAVDVDLAPASVHLVLDPSVRFGATVAAEPGLTERVGAKLAVGVRFVMAPALDYRVKGRFANGEAIPWSEVYMAAGILIFGYGGGLCALGCWTLRRREIALPV